ncbi:MAG: trigger factor [Deltaproteobacteria bacterium]
MKTSVEAVSGIEKRIRVEVPAEEVSRRIEEGYAEVRKLAPLKGFRKGKAPMSMVKRVFRESVESDVAEHLVKESLADAIRSNDIKIVSMPKIDGAQLKEGEEFVFTATVEVVPEIAADGYRGIPVAREKVEVGDADVDGAIEKLRESFARYHAVEGRGAADGDLVEYAFVASSAGDVVEKSDSGTAVLGGGLPFGREFEAALSGVTAGEKRTFDVTFPEAFPNRKFAGKTVSFDVTANAVREKRLPGIDDEFAKNFTEISGLADLREKMRDRLRHEAEERSRLGVEEEIRRALVERIPFEVPGTLVDRQIVSMMEDTANRMASQGIDLKKINLDYEKMRERFAPNAERAVRVSLILEAIARKENIDVPFAEIEAEMKAIAEGLRMDYGKVREMYGDEARMDDLRSRLVGRKVMEFLLANAETKEGGEAR